MYSCVVAEWASTVNFQWYTDWTKLIHDCCFCMILLFISRITNQGILSHHYNAVIMCRVASQITSVSIVCSTVGSGAYQLTHQSSAGNCVNSPHKRPVTRKMYPFDDVIMFGSNRRWLMRPTTFIVIDMDMFIGSIDQFHMAPMYQVPRFI